MSVCGVGVDIVSVARVARVYERFGARFLARTLHPSEVARVEALREASPSRAAGFLASRWAAKEALHKALRGRVRLLFPDVEVATAADGGPTIRLHHAAAAFAASPAEAGLELHVSLSHERDSAVAVVIASRAAGGGVGGGMQ